ncbi:unnamed protein product [Gordionus sp. m RMFG-2023]
MQQAWAAVLANLEDSLSAFRRRSTYFLDVIANDGFGDASHSSRDTNLPCAKSARIFRRFFKSRLVERAINALGKIPKSESMTMLEYVERRLADAGVTITATNVQFLRQGTETAKQNNSSLDKNAKELDFLDDLPNKENVEFYCDSGGERIKTLLASCLSDLSSMSLGTDSAQLKMEITLTLDSADNEPMKRIGGLENRLFGLERLVAEVERLYKDQAELTRGFIQNQYRANKENDPSILPDLCSSHKRQLSFMLKQFSHVKELTHKSFMAKRELANNIHSRLKWVCFASRQLCSVDAKLSAMYVKLRTFRVKCQLLMDICHLPVTCLLYSAERDRRKMFDRTLNSVEKSFWQDEMIPITAKEHGKREYFEKIIMNDALTRQIFPPFRDSNTAVHFHREPHYLPPTYPLATNRIKTGYLGSDLDNEYLNQLDFEKVMRSLKRVDFAPLLVFYVGNDIPDYLNEVDAQNLENVSPNTDSPNRLDHDKILETTLVYPFSIFRSLFSADSASRCAIITDPVDRRLPALALALTRYKYQALPKNTFPKGLSPTFLTAGFNNERVGSCRSSSWPLIYRRAEGGNILRSLSTSCRSSANDNSPETLRKMQATKQSRSFSLNQLHRHSLVENFAQSKIIEFKLACCLAKLKRLKSQCFAVKHDYSDWLKVVTGPEISRLTEEVMRAVSGLGAKMENNLQLKVTDLKKGYEQSLHQRTIEMELREAAIEYSASALHRQDKCAKPANSSNSSISNGEIPTHKQLIFPAQVDGPSEEENGGRAMEEEEDGEGEGYYFEDDFDYGDGCLIHIKNNNHNISHNEQPTTGNYHLPFTIPHLKSHSHSDSEPVDHGWDKGRVGPENLYIEESASSRMERSAEQKLLDCSTASLMFISSMEDHHQKQSSTYPDFIEENPNNQLTDIPDTISTDIANFYALLPQCPPYLSSSSDPVFLINSFADEEEEVRIHPNLVTISNVPLKTFDDDLLNTNGNNLHISSINEVNAYPSLTDAAVTMCHDSSDIRNEGNDTGEIYLDSSHSLNETHHNSENLSLRAIQNYAHFWMSTRLKDYFKPAMFYGCGFGFLDCSEISLFDSISDYVERHVDSMFHSSILLQNMDVLDIFTKTVNDVLDIVLTIVQHIFGHKVPLADSKAVDVENAQNIDFFGVGEPMISLSWHDLVHTATTFSSPAITDISGFCREKFLAQLASNTSKSVILLPPISLTDSLNSNNLYSEINVNMTRSEMNLLPSIVKSLHSPPTTNSQVHARSTLPKIIINNLSAGDHCLFYRDRRHNNLYVALCLDSQVYFLHSDSHHSFVYPLSSPPSDDNYESSTLTPQTLRGLEDIVLGRIESKEYCLTKKCPNRFGLDIGQKFYRIRATPVDHHAEFSELFDMLHRLLKSVGESFEPV